MEFKYALSILFSRFGYVFKILVWLIISLAITAAVGCAILIPLGNVIERTTDACIYFEDVAKVITDTVSGSQTVRGAVTAIIPLILSVLGAISENVGAAVGLAFALIFLYSLYCFVFGISFYGVADIINKSMESNMKFGLSSSMAMNFKTCCKFSLAKLSISLPIDLLIATIMFAILFGLFKYIGLFAMAMLILVIIVACSLRACLFAGWLPRMLHHPEETVYTSLLRSFTFVKYNFSGLFKAYAITFTLVYLLLALLALPTGGLAFIVLPPVYYFMLRTIELVGYCKTQGYSFYTDATTVINTVEFGYRSANQQDEQEIFEAYENETRVHTFGGDGEDR